MVSTRGFTLIELLVSLAIVATILSVAVPRYFSNIETAQENVLKEDLYVLRDAIDHYVSDQGAYPCLLSDLTTKNYLRATPIDPFTKSANSWTTVANSANTCAATAEAGYGVYDVHSGSPNQARNGTWLASW